MRLVGLVIVTREARFTKDAPRGRHHPRKCGANAPSKSRETRQWTFDSPPIDGVWLLLFYTVLLLHNLGRNEVKLFDSRRGVAFESEIEIGLLVDCVGDGRRADEEESRVVRMEEKKRVALIYFFYCVLSAGVNTH